MVFNPRSCKGGLSNEVNWQSYFKFKSRERMRERGREKERRNTYRDRD